MLTPSSVRAALPRRAFVLALLSIATLLSVALTSGGPAQGAAAPERDPWSAPSEVARFKDELPALRTRHSRTFVTEGGQRVTRVFSGSMHFRAADGSWQSIDNTLQTRGGKLRNRGNRYELALPQNLSDGVRVEEDGDWLTFRLRDAQAPAQAHGSTAKYAGALPGVDVTYEAQADAVKENVILRNAQAARPFVFDLDVRDGLRPRLTEAGTIDIVDADGESRMEIAAPFMADAAGAESRKVAFALDEVDAAWRLTMTADRDWLSAPERRFPVAIDPVVHPRPARDCTLRAQYAETNYCSGDLKVGYDGVADNRALLHFDVQAAVPTDSEIHMASMKLYLRSQSTNNKKKIWAYPMSRSWTGGATWNRWDGTNRWTSPGGDADTANPAEWNPVIGGNPTAPLQVDRGDYFAAMWSGWAPKKIVEDWVQSRKPNLGLMLRDDGGTVNNVLTFDSNEHATAAQRPYIDILHSPRLGDRRGFKFESFGLTDRMGAQVNSATGNLMIRNGDLRIAGGLGPDLNLGRTYNSLQKDHLSFGQGFGMSTGRDFRAHVLETYDVVLHTPGGGREFFDYDGNGVFKAPSGLDATLKRDETPGSDRWSDSYTLTQNGSQTKYKFRGHDGRLVTQEDRNGRKLNFTYTAGTDRLESITDDQGKVTRLSYDTAGRVSKIVDPGLREYVYTYDSSGRLLSFCEPGGALTKYEWGAEGINRIITPAGRVLNVDYYPAGDPNQFRVKRVVRVANATAARVDQTGPTWNFTYVMRRDRSGESTVTDPNGHEVRTYFDESSRPTKATDGLGRTTSQKYTTSSKVQSYQSAANTGTTPNTTFSFDDDDNMTGSVTPTGSTSPTGEQNTIKTSAAYGAAGNVPGTVSGSRWLPGQATNAEGKTNYMTYDNGGNLASVRNQSPTNINVSYTYDPAAPGKLTKITDARNNSTSYAYDTKGNLTRIVPPLPMGATTLTYNTQLSRVESVTDGKGKLRTMSYDSRDRVTKIAYADGSYVSFTYDRDGNLLTQADSVGGTTTNTYDAVGRLVKEDKPSARSTSYGYDPVGNLTSLTDSGGVVEYGYDAANQNTAVYEPGVANPVRFTYDDDGMRTKVEYPNGVSISNEFDKAHRLERITSMKTGALSPIQKFSYVYAEPDQQREVDLRVVATDEVTNKRTRYLYDDLNRLVRARTYTAGQTPAASTVDCATQGDLRCHEYVYDGVSNRVREQVTGSEAGNAVTTYSYDAANQLGSKTSGTTTNTYGYDANGNETSNGAGRTTAYNLRDQATSMTLNGTTTALGYLGAGQGDRVQAGDIGFQFNVIGMGARFSPTAGASYFTRDESGQLVSQRAGSARHYYLFDALGSVTGLTDTAGNLVRDYKYDPYGNTTATSGTATNYFRFAGGYLGTGGLYHFGQRYYDASVGRWTQRDPLDQTGDLREGNAYVYAAADPVNLTDPRGLWALEINASLGPVSFGAGVDHKGKVGFKGGLGTGTKPSASVGVSSGTYKDGEVEGNVGGCTGFTCGSASVNKKGGTSFYGGIGAGAGADASVTRTWVMND